MVSSIPVLLSDRIILDPFIRPDQVQFIPKQAVYKTYPSAQSLGQKRPQKRSTTVILWVTNIESLHKTHIIPTCICCIFNTSYHMFYIKLCPVIHSQTVPAVLISEYSSPKPVQTHSFSSRTAPGPEHSIHSKLWNPSALVQSA